MTFNSRLHTDGRPTPRIDGTAKVTGGADYTADCHLPGMAYGAIVQATIGRGLLDTIHVADALAMPGVLHVFTHKNSSKLRKATAFPLGAAWQTNPPLLNNKVAFSGQIIALVVAGTLEVARAAATLIQPTYKKVQPALGNLAAGPVEPIASLGLMAKFTSEDTHRGDVNQALAQATLYIDQQYETPRHLHMAMEPHATVAWWDKDGRLTVREGTQWVDGAQDVFATWFGLKRDQVRLLSEFVGGGFGLRVGALPHAGLAAMAARELKRPVKLVLDRREVCLLSSGRPATRQRIQIGADADGRIRAMIHDTINETSRDTVFNEPGSRASKSTYAIENYQATHSVVQLDMAPPAWMRAPGETPGSFALESAMDELAETVGLNPLELRLRNYAEFEPSTGKPWSTNHLRQAYALGAQTFGWSAWQAKPRMRREGNELIGLGMATASYSSKQAPSEANLRLGPDGRVTLESRGVDIGTGAYTAMALVVSESLGINIDQVTVRFGDTAFARSAFAGGSMMTASLGAAVYGAAQELKAKLLALAVTIKKSPFYQKSKDMLHLANGQVSLLSEPGQVMDFAHILRASQTIHLISSYHTRPSLPSYVLGPKAFTSMAAIAGPTSGERAVHSWGAHFAEVRVDEKLGVIRVSRLVGAFDCGRIINPTTARSQLIGGMIMGLGMALSEEVAVDPRSARPTNANLGEYLVPVQADIPELDVRFVGEFDESGGPLGGKAVGELGITGAAAAIANAVYNATGQRLRRLPLRLG